MALTNDELKEGTRTCKIICTSMCVGTVLLIVFLATLIPSFKYVEYNEYGLLQHKFGEVELTPVYKQGRYIKSPIYRMVTLPSVYQLIDIKSAVFSNLGLEFDIHIVVYYRLPEETLGEIYHQFSTNYGNRIENIVKTIVKDTATEYNVDDYVKNRRKIQEKFSREVHRQLTSSIKIDIPSLFFRLLDIDFPQTVVSSSLTSAIELQNNQIQFYKQQVAIIEADTNNLVAAILIQTNMTLSYANIQAKQIIANSISQADGIVAAARGQGISYTLHVLNITTPVLRDEFIKLISILDGINPKVLSGKFNTLVSI